MLSAGKPRVSVHEGITTPQYILKKDSLELQHFPLFHRTRRRLCTLKPASATYGAKLLLRKVPQYMGHSAVCQVGRHRFFYDDEIGLKSVYRAIASRQKSPEIPRNP